MHDQDPEVAAVAAHSGDRVLGVPVFPGAVEAAAMRESVHAAWARAEEPVFMDHEMEFPGLGSQLMFTGMMVAPDGALVKFTITRPFFRYPDQQAIDRTVIQLGRVARSP